MQIMNPWVEIPKADDERNHLSVANSCEEIGDPSAADACWRLAAELAYKNGEQDLARIHWGRVLDGGLLAQDYEREEQWAWAAEVYELLGQWDPSEALWGRVKAWERVARVCEKQEKWDHAARTWEGLAKWGEAERCWGQIQATAEMARVCQRDLRWAEAATHFEACDEWEEAGHCWDQAREWAAAARCFRMAGFHRAAARMWEWCGSLAEAAADWRTVQEWERAARLWEEMGQPQEAVEDWREAGNLQRVAELLEDPLGDFWEAAEIWRDLAQWERAARLFERVEHPAGWRQGLRCWSMIEAWDPMARLHLKLGEAEEAGHLWEEHGDYVSAAEAFESVPKLYDAVRCWKQAEEWVKAADLLRQTGSELDLDLAANYYQRGEAFLQAAACWVQLKDWIGAAECFRQGEDFAAAADCWEQKELWEEALQDWRRVQRWEEMARILLGLGRKLEAAAVWEEGSEDEKAALLYEELGDPDALKGGIRCWEKLGRSERMAPLYEEVGDFRAAALLWEKLNQIERAIENWRQIESWHEIARLQELLGLYAAAIENYQKPSPDWTGIRRCAKLCNPVLWGWVAEACVQLEQYSEAAEAYVKLEDPLQAATYFDLAKLYSRAAEQWEKVGDLERARASWKNGREWLNVIRVCKQQNTSESWVEAARILEIELRDPGQAADIFYRYGQKESAFRCWKKDPYSKQMAKAKETEGNWILAADIWYACEQWENAGNAWMKAQNYCSAVTAYEKALNTPPIPKQPRPEALPDPKQIEGRNVFTTAVAGAAIAAAEIAAGPIGWGIGAYGLYRATLGFKQRKEAYDKRQNEIQEWNQQCKEQIKKHEEKINSITANILTSCGCKTQCLGIYNVDIANNNSDSKKLPFGNKDMLCCDKTVQEIEVVNLNDE